MVQKFFITVYLTMMLQTLCFTFLTVSGNGRKAYGFIMTIISYVISITPFAILSYILFVVSVKFQ